MAAERRLSPDDEARVAEYRSKIKIVWIANDGSDDPLDALVDLLASVWLSRQGLGKVPDPGAEEQRETG